MATVQKRTRRKASAPAESPSNPGAAIPRARSHAFSEQVGGEVSVPNLATTTEKAPLPRLQVRPQFVYAWSITQWMVMHGQLIPSLQQVRLQPGVRRVRKIGDRIDVSDLRSHMESRGWRLIPHDLGPGGSYMRRHKTDPTGQGRYERVTYLTAWEQPYAGSDRVTSDEQGYAEWCAGLVDSGVVPTCPIVIARNLEERTRSRLSRMEEKYNRGAESLKPNIDALKAELQVITDYLDEAEAQAVPVDGAVDSIDLGEVPNG